MNEIWQLIISNRAWIFEGIGVFVLGGIVVGLKHFLNRRKNKMTSTNTQVIDKTNLVAKSENENHESQPPTPNFDNSGIVINRAKVAVNGTDNKVQIGHNYNIQTERRSSNGKRRRNKN